MICIVVHTDSISSQKAFSISPTLNEDGEYKWTVRVFLEQATIAQELINSIEFYERRNFDIDQLLMMETDPEVRKALSAVLD